MEKKKLFGAWVEARRRGEEKNKRKNFGYTNRRERELGKGGREGGCLIFLACLAASVYMVLVF